LSLTLSGCSSPSSRRRLRLIQCHDRGGDRADHRDDEEQEVGQQHRPQAAQRAEDDRDGEATRIVCSGAKPNITAPILIAASVTAAMMQTLKNTPRYSARKPRRNAADAWPE
jgi:hypothetical protein